jgi:hypothetical protein
MTAYILTAAIPVRADWTPAAPLLSPPTYSIPIAAAVTSADEAFVMISDDLAKTHLVRAGADGVWGIPETVPNIPSGGRIRYARLAPFGVGLALVWSEEVPGTASQILSVAIRDGRGDWSGRVELSAFNPGPPILLSAVNGTLAVVWDDSSAGSNPRTLHVAQYSSGRWTREIVSTEFAGSDPVAAVGPRGDIAVAWLAPTPAGRSVGPDSKSVSAVVRSASTGQWTEPQIFVEPRNRQAFGPSIALDRVGRVVVAWYEYRPDVDPSKSATHVIQAAQWKPRARRWFAPVTLSDARTPGLSVSPQVMIGMDDTAVVAWPTADPNTGAYTFTQMSTRQLRRGPWSVPADLLPNPTGSPSLAITTSGVITLAGYSDSDASNPGFSLIAIPIRRGVPGPTQIVREGRSIEFNAPIIAGGSRRTVAAWAESPDGEIGPPIAFASFQ